MAPLAVLELVPAAGLGGVALEVEPAAQGRREGQAGAEVAEVLGLLGGRGRLPPRLPPRPVLLLRPARPFLFNFNTFFASAGSACGQRACPFRVFFCLLRQSRGPGEDGRSTDV